MRCKCIPPFQIFKGNLNAIIQASCSWFRQFDTWGFNRCNTSEITSFIIVLAYYRRIYDYRAACQEEMHNLPGPHCERTEVIQAATPIPNPKMKVQ